MIPWPTTDSDGHGLVLAIVRDLCERFDWRLEIASREGSGTRVTIDFESARQAPDGTVRA